MTLPKNTNFLRWIIIIASFIIISLILWNTYIFFQNFKTEERNKMQNWSSAYQEINDRNNLSDNIGGLPLEIIQSNNTTPTILTDAEGNILNSKNILERKINDSIKVKKLKYRYKRKL